MGLNIGLNSLTAGGLFLTTVILLLMGILLYTASKKIEENEDFESNEDLEKINSHLKTAYILIFIAAGLTLLVTIAYAGHEVYWAPSEWLHAFIYFVDVVVLIVGGVYAYGALNDLNVPELEQSHNGADGYIWASLLLGLFTLMGLIVTGAARVGYHTVREETRKRLGEAEVKLHQVHDKVVGAGRDLLKEAESVRYSEPIKEVREPLRESVRYSEPLREPLRESVRYSAPLSPRNSYAPPRISTRAIPPSETITINEVPNLEPINVDNANMSTSIDLRQPLPLVRPSVRSSLGSLRPSSPRSFGSTPVSELVNRPLNSGSFGSGSFGNRPLSVSSMSSNPNYIPLSRNL